MNGSNRLKKKERDREHDASGKDVTQLHSFLRFLKAQYKTILLVAIVAVISLAGSALISIMLMDIDSDVYLPTFATIKTIGVETYEDQDGVVKQETLSWDEITIEKLDWNEITVEPVSSTVYVKSVSNFRVTMNIFLSDWSPEEISEHLTVSWDYDSETVLEPGEIIPVTVTVSAPSSDAFIEYILENEIQGFNFAIHFVATE